MYPIAFTYYACVARPPVPTSYLDYSRLLVDLTVFDDYVVVILSSETILSAMLQWKADLRDCRPHKTTINSNTDCGLQDKLTVSRAVRITPLANLPDL